jgi:eukaryotic-like serine/threonine-protein kinase
MTALSDAAVRRLQALIERPALPPRYAPQDIIGRGGMGVVWRAHDRELERDVAIKVLAPHLDGIELATRLRREARILARLEHPGIVPVHDVGVTEDGRAWYVMRLVLGTRLDEVAPRVESLGELLRIVARLCETVAYAHAHGVLHRDLKPGNVMIGPFGEVLVLDWGVAKEQNRQEMPSDGKPATPAPSIPPLTDPGLVLGTPGYMSPEQAAGQTVDERADVYGLGAILRDLLATRRERVPPALLSIRNRALGAEPAGRYPGALALRDELTRFLDGARVEAHPEGVIEMAHRFVGLYRTPILLVLAYLVMRVAILLWRGI